MIQPQIQMYGQPHLHSYNNYYNNHHPMIPGVPQHLDPYSYNNQPHGYYNPQFLPNQQQRHMQPSNYHQYSLNERYQKPYHNHDDELINKKRRSYSRSLSSDRNKRRSRNGYRSRSKSPQSRKHDRRSKSPNNKRDNERRRSRSVNKYRKNNQSVSPRHRSSYSRSPISHNNRNRNSENRSRTNKSPVSSNNKRKNDHRHDLSTSSRNSERNIKRNHTRSRSKSKQKIKSPSPPRFQSSNTSRRHSNSDHIVIMIPRMNDQIVVKIKIVHQNQ